MRLIEVEGKIKDCCDDQINDFYQKQKQEFVSKAL